MTARSGATKFLLDTHALLWWLFDDPKLSLTARALIADPSNTIFVSAASGWEIATKVRLGKLPAASVLVGKIDFWVGQAGFQPLPISVAHADKAGSFPQAHRDPFDRMLAAQSVLEHCPLVTCDAALASFGVDMRW